MLKFIGKPIYGVNKKKHVWKTNSKRNKAEQRGFKEYIKYIIYLENVLKLLFINNITIYINI